MHLYTPLDGRTVTIEKFIISSTGLQVDELIPCLEAVLDTLLKRESDTPVTKPVEVIVTEPEIVAK